MVEKRTPPRPRGRPPAFDDEEALDAAMRAFWANGYASTDLNAVAAAVGATKPSFYRRFGDKRALFGLALDRYCDGIGSDPLAAFAAEPDIKAAARALLTTSIRNGDGGHGARGCMIACVATDVGRSFDEIRQVCATADAALIDALTTRFKAETDAGRLAPPPSPGLRARMLADLMNATALRSRAGEDASALLAEVDQKIAVLLGAPPV